MNIRINGHFYWADWSIFPPTFYKHPMFLCRVSKLELILDDNSLVHKKNNLLEQNLESILFTKNVMKKWKRIMKFLIRYNVFFLYYISDIMYDFFNFRTLTLRRFDVFFDKSMYTHFSSAFHSSNKYVSKIFNILT